MHRAIAIAVLAAVLAGCDMLSTLVDGFKFAKAVEGDLERVTGLRPRVGFEWKNGRLLSVTVAFPRLYEDKPVRELAAEVRAAVGKEFRQTPDDIVLSFSLGRTTSGATALLQPTQAQRTASNLAGARPSQ